MLKDKLDQIMEEFKTGKITFMDFRNKIICETYRNYNMYRKVLPELDDFHDFLLFFIPQIQTVLTKYKPELSKFSTFYFTFINTAIKRWKYIQRFNEIKKDISLVGEESLLMDTMEKYSKSEAENHLEIFHSRINSQQKCTIKDLMSDQRKENSERKNNGIIKRAVIIAGLKLSYYMSDERLKSISEFTGVSQEELFEKKEEVKNQLQGKISKAEKRMEIIQKSYSNHRKFMLENILLEKENWTDITKENRIYCSKWKKITKDISSDSSLCVKASNRTIAEILETNEKKIAYALECAAKMIATMEDLDCNEKNPDYEHIEQIEHLQYINRHENLFGNRKRKQKKGNAGNAPSASDCNSKR